MPSLGSYSDVELSKTLLELSQLLDFTEDAVQIIAMQPEHCAIRSCLLVILEPSFLMNRSDSRYLKIVNSADISIS